MEDQQPENLANALKNLATALTTDEAAPPFSVGGALRDARVHLGMSVADVAARVKFAPKQIEALEADDFKSLPEPAFVRGFIRSYARVVGLDGVELVARLPNAVPAPAPAQVVSEPVQQDFETVPFSGGEPKSKQGLIWGAGLVVAVVVGLIVLFSGDETEVPVESAALHVEPVMLAESAPQAESAPVAASAPAVASAPAAVSAPAVTLPAVAPRAASAPVAAASESPLRLIFDEASWVEVKDAGGKVLLSKSNPAGSEQALSGAAPYSLIIGRASHVRVSYKGQFVDLTPYTVADVARLKLEK